VRFGHSSEIHSTETRLAAFNCGVEAGFQDEKTTTYVAARVRSFETSKDHTLGPLQPSFNKVIEYKRVSTSTEDHTKFWKEMSTAIGFCGKPLVPFEMFSGKGFGRRKLCEKFHKDR
jgi:hypothetical protein